MRREIMVAKKVDIVKTMMMAETRKVGTKAKAKGRLARNQRVEVRKVMKVIVIVMMTKERARVREGTKRTKRKRRKKKKGRGKRRRNEKKKG